MEYWICACGVVDGRTGVDAMDFLIRRVMTNIKGRPREELTLNIGYRKERGMWWEGKGREGKRREGKRGKNHGKQMPVS